MSLFGGGKRLNQEFNVLFVAALVVDSSTKASRSTFTMASLTQLVTPLAKFGAFISPPPPFTDYAYDGLEFRWKALVFRPARKLKWLIGRLDTIADICFVKSSKLKELS